MPYLCFTNTHDGTGSVRVFTTGIRVVCNNTLNQALNNAKRTWSVRHTGSIESKLAEATETLNLANNYMAELKKECEELALKKIDNNKVIILFPKMKICLRGREQILEIFVMIFGIVILTLLILRIGIILA